MYDFVKIIISFCSKKSSQALIKDQPEDVTRLETNFREKLAELGEVTTIPLKYDQDLMRSHFVKGNFETRNCSSRPVDSIKWFDKQSQRVV